MKNKEKPDTEKLIHLKFIILLRRFLHSLKVSSCWMLDVILLRLNQLLTDGFE